MAKCYAVLVLGLGGAVKLVGVRTDRPAALELWNRTRRRLRKSYKKQLAEWNEKYPGSKSESLAECIKKLKNDDPKTCDNYPYKTPFLRSTEDFQ